MVMRVKSSDLRVAVSSRKRFILSWSSFMVRLSIAKSPLAYLISQMLMVSSLRSISRSICAPLGEAFDVRQAQTRVWTAAMP